MFADYFTVLVSTEKGPALMLVTRDDATVDTTPIKTSYSAAAGTAYVVFDQAKVPVADVIGEVGNGFAYAMYNFNKERWGMVVAGNRLSRLMVSASRV
jgi:alkylation response protein AidB-like acyl-CoA dehydrogenase